MSEGRLRGGKGGARVTVLGRIRRVRKEEWLWVGGRGGGITLLHTYLILSRLPSHIPISARTFEYSNGRKWYMKC